MRGHFYYKDLTITDLLQYANFPAISENKFELFLYLHGQEAPSQHKEKHRVELGLKQSYGVMYGSGYHHLNLLWGLLT